MELEVKHLAPYLPYGLKLVFENYPLHTKDCPHVRILELDCGHDFNLYLQRGHIKPILNPKTHIHNLQHEILIRWGGGLADRAKSEWLKTMTDDMLYSAYNSLRYDFIEFMAEHHIDIFGLIPARLAIDINTLNNK